ncbi:hypothetical protein Pmgp_00676 [Pelotomaculum propionicicum]|uniref:Uncharacterized protein n=1 Tax=Pelotomaculum propionicicum TaxID=258475 RepID=A0A4Y7RVJ4_9FIRM|nr:hypothetical protein Pmgp_00676 [Pelotomaculum propionicicum]
MHGGDSHAAADAGDAAVILDVRGQAQGAYKIFNAVAFAQCAQLFGGFADFLEDAGDGPFLAVEIGDGQGNPLA